MPFIVSLYKYLIFAFCFAILVMIALAVMVGMDPANPMAEALTPYMIASAIMAVIFLVLCLGSLAILISLHDRHREIAEGIDRIAIALERAANSSGNIS